MKNVKYKVGKKEDISCLPYNSLVLNAKILFSNEEGGLIYIPRKIKYQFEDEISYDTGGMGSLSFAVFDKFNNWWIRAGEDYLNITLKKYENEAK